MGEYLVYLLWMNNHIFKIVLGHISGNLMFRGEHEDVLQVGLESIILYFRLFHKTNHLKDTHMIQNYWEFTIVK